MPRRCAAPSGGCRPRGCGGARSRRRASAGLAGPRSTWPQDTRSGRPATRRGRDGGGEVSSYLATRGGVDDAAEQGGRPDGYPVDYDRAALERPQAVVCTGCHLERTPADVVRGDGVCADCRADGLGRDPMVVRCEAILAAAVRRGPWARRELRRLWNAADAADRATITAWVAAHDARIPRPRATAHPRLPSPRPGHPHGDRAAPRGGGQVVSQRASPRALAVRGRADPAVSRACPSSPAHRSRPAAAISDPAVTTR